VNGAPVIATGTIATMAILAQIETSLLVSQGYTLAVVDTAANIEGLTIAQINNLSLRDVLLLQSSDTSVALSAKLALLLEAANMKVTGFVVGDTIDLTDLPYDPSDSSYSVAPGSGSDNYLVTFDEGTSSYSLQFNQSTPVTRTEFVLYEDGNGGTEVTRPIATNSVTALLQVGNHYELDAVSAGTGPAA
jgi:hypothetical protein